MNVLLVEPSYKNKYPPMGLMKISTYHKNRGDDVTFFKGELSNDNLKKICADRVYITSLFTFYFDKTVDTIKYYQKYFKNENIFVGGIMASLLTEKLIEATGLNNILVGLLTNSHVLGLNDKVCIDSLPLDYSILDEIEYCYPAGDNYFAYTTRGCPNHCKFCAVPILEPQYTVIPNIDEQLQSVNNLYGQKKNLLLLDNNVFNLSVHQLSDLVEKLKSVGFTKNPTFIQENPFDLFLRKYGNIKIHKRISTDAAVFLCAFSRKIKNSLDKISYINLLISCHKSGNCTQEIYIQKEKFIFYINKYSKKTKVKRYIDFNQGLEAARITEEKMQLLSQLPLRPARIAFDHYNQAAIANYTNAVYTAAKCGIRDFSNYMLYNYDDSPADLWERLKINIELSKKDGINIFSFPMKYIPISQTDRKYIGPKWNKKFLQAIPAILLVTKGIVASGEAFFLRAFGHDLNEFHKILTMPRDFITYRHYYDNNELTQQWSDIYEQLDEHEIENLLDILSEKKQLPISNNITRILEYYESKYRYTHLIKKKI